MDRFFSKLDLRDIKIDPEAKFPPDEVSYAEVDHAEHSDNNVSWDDAEAAVATTTQTAVKVEQRNGEVLKVSARSRPSAVAGAIAGVVRESGRAEVQAIGAGATNQAVKAVAIARDYLLETGIEAICLPAFIDVTIDDEDRTAIRLIVEPR
ncbi:MAG TPA: stage V sporulation protein S [Thermomicrobiales bacterium]|nr:stage V sporulation protein S [Thermomicrobiales bacterium]